MSKLKQIIIQFQEDVRSQRNKRKDGSPVRRTKGRTEKRKETQTLSHMSTKTNILVKKECEKWRNNQDNFYKKTANFDKLDIMNLIEMKI